MDVLDFIAQQRAELTAQRAQLDARLAGLDAAEDALRRRPPAPGASAHRGPLPPSGSAKDMVLVVLRDAAPGGLTRWEIAVRLHRDHGARVLPGTITYALSAWRHIGRARRVGRTWFHVTDEGDLFAEA